MPGMKLHVIGAGCPSPTGPRFGSAFVLEVGQTMALVDCGPGTTHKLARMGIPLTQLDYLFLTHHHFDHNVDFACFALCRWDRYRGVAPPLAVYGPKPTQRFVELLMGPQGVFAPDLNSRMVHPASLACHKSDGSNPQRELPRFDVHEVDAGPVAEMPQWTVTAERVKHVDPTLISLAYRFETPEGTIVFAADCADCPGIRSLAKDADAIVMACTHFGPTQIEPAIIDVITGTQEVVAIANDAGVKSVVLTHASPNFLRPGVVEHAIAEVARGYGGRIYFPDELTTVDLSQPIFKPRA